LSSCRARGEFTDGVLGTRRRTSPPPPNIAIAWSFD